VIAALSDEEGIARAGRADRQIVTERAPDIDIAGRSLSFRTQYVINNRIYNYEPDPGHGGRQLDDLINKLTEVGWESQRRNSDWYGHKFRRRETPGRIMSNYVAEPVKDDVTAHPAQRDEGPVKLGPYISPIRRW
jgi:hypothetical protein